MTVEAKDANPLGVLWQKGLLSTGELRGAVQLMVTFFQMHDRQVGFPHYRPLHDHFQESGGTFFVRVKKSKVYTVDPQFMEAHLEEVDSIIVGLKERRRPKRTEEERRRFQEQILRKKDAGGNLHAASLDDVSTYLVSNTVAYCQKIGKHEEAEDIAHEAFERSLPYLTGEAGDFSDIDQFRRAVYWRVVRSVIAKFRKQMDTDSKRLVFQSTENVPMDVNGETSLGQDMQEALKRRRPKDRRLMELLGKKYSWEVIAREMDSSVGAVKVQYFRLRRKLASERDGEGEKRVFENPIHGISDEALLILYATYRRIFIRAHGRIPSSADFDKAAYHKGELICRHKVFARRFGGGKWGPAQAKLEEMVRDWGLD